MNHRLKLKWNADPVLWSLLWKDVTEKTLSIFSTNKMILDVGCGASNTLISLKQFKERIIGIDIERESLKLSPYQNILTSAHDLPFRREIFDGIHCRGVIHHLNVDLLFPELLYVSKKNSTIIVLEPLKGLFTRLIRFFITTDAHDPNEHPLSKKNIKKLGFFINITGMSYIFFELSYLLPFILPLIPNFLLNITRNLILFLNLMKKKYPPYAYLFITGTLINR